MLILTRKAGEAFVIGENVYIKIEEIKGDKAKISISAPKEVSILRKELLDAQDANKEALSPEVSNIEAFQKNLRKR